MNYIDIAILAIITISFLVGMYDGLVITLLSLGSFILSWLGALLFYSTLSRYLLARFPDLLQKIIYYTDGASKLKSIEHRSVPIDTVDSPTIFGILKEAKLPQPFEKLLQQNLINKNLPEVETIGEYFNHSIAMIILNILSFIAIFIAIKLLFTILISIFKTITEIPVLKQIDSVLGGAFGIFRGLIFLFLIFALVPLVLTVAPVDIIQEYIETSKLASFFIKSNIFTTVIRGII